MSEKNFRVMSIMAHQDDFEFSAGGTFALLRKTLGDRVSLKIIATTRGAGGHHEMLPEKTFRRRDAEARKSAAVIGAEYECLRRLDGSHSPMQVFIDRNLLGGLWNAIRAFEPDVIFCPPVVTDPLAGIHIDHQNTAMAVRMVAYQLIVPRAYPTTDGPVKQRVRSPLIINVADNYSRETAFDIRQDISEVYESKLEMALCHESQVFEWLPWTGGREIPLSREQVIKEFQERHENINHRQGIADGVKSEFFRITRWAREPENGELERLFPRMIAGKPE